MSEVPVQDVPLSAVIVGEESLLIQCGQILRDKGIRLAALASDSEAPRQWADEQGIPVVGVNASLADELRSFNFDYLFSITNLSILPAAVLDQARSLAANFHDGPLPRYAGLHATSWALMHGEKRHGVSWHVIEAGVDQGDLLVQSDFDVGDDDTSYTLNVRCYEHAMVSFAELVDGLIEGTTTRRKQDFAARSYFGKFDRPSGAGIVDWNQTVPEIRNLARALQFGPHHNPLGLPKVAFGPKLYAIDATPLASDDVVGDPAEPGTVVGVDAGAVLVQARDGVVRLSGLISLATGKHHTAAEALSIAGVSIGDTLPVFSPEVLAGVTERARQAARDESIWASELARGTSVSVPYARARTSERQTAEAEVIEFTLGESGLLVADKPQPSSWVLAGFAQYLARLTGEIDFQLSLGLQNRADAIGPDILTSRGPVTCNIDEKSTVGHGALQLAAAFEEAFGRFGPLQDLGLRLAKGNRIPLDAVGLGLGPTVGIDYGLVDGAPLLSDGLELLLAVDQAPSGRPIRCQLIFDPAVYDLRDVERMAAQFQHFMAEIGDKPTANVRELDLLDAQERHRLVVETNSTSKAVEQGVTLVDLFRRQVAGDPDSVAVVHGSSSVTYAEVDRLSDVLAAELRSNGVGPGSLVGIFMDRGVDMIVSLLATLKADAGYVPLDPEYPAERLAFMVEDAAIELLLTQTSLEASVPSPTARVLAVDRPFDANRAAPAPSEGDPDSLAYVIYTSGSTGKPKGVMVRHRNVVNFLEGMDDLLGAEPGDSWLTVTSLSFDISVLEIFWSLTRGLKLVVYSDSLRASGADEESSKSLASAEMDRPMGFSLFYFASDEEQPEDGSAYELLLEGAKFADRNGFEAVWTPERHFYAFGGLYPNPAVTGAAVAAVTDRIAVRAGSCVLPLHHPVRVAEEWAVVDNLSGGRVGIAFATGWQPDDFVLQPQNFHGRKEELLDNIETVHRLWRGESVELEGPAGAVRARTLPRPVQSELPTWLTIAGNPDTFTAAGQAGFNVLTHLLGQSLDDLEEKIALYRAAWNAAGHPGEGHVTLMAHTFVGQDLESVRETVRGPLTNYLRTSVELIREAAWSFPTFQERAASTGRDPMELFADEDLTPRELEALLDHAFNRYFDQSGLFGTVESCRETVAKASSIGVDEMACQIDFGVPFPQVMEHLPLLDALRQSCLLTEAGEMPETSLIADVSEPQTIPALLEKHEITHFQCTPSMGRVLAADEQFRRAAGELKYFLMGGEAFPQALADDVTKLGTGTNYNVYGPTETTIWSAAKKLRDGEAVTLGQPLANQQLYIVDEELRPVPIGVPGELLIGGDGVTAGYLNRPELTAERFVDDHFRPDIAGAKLYRTGDLVRRGADEEIEFLGRMDFQVKVRGHRIELGEIETALGLHPAVSEAVVSVREDQPGDQRIVAYVIWQDGEDRSSEELVDHLVGKLPDFMVPTQFVFLTSFPLTPNNKTDRAALPAPAQHRNEATASAPATDPTQQKLVELWQELLGTPQVGIQDNFFDLGGHSLLAVQLHRQVQSTLEVELSITDVFRFPTIETLTAHLRDSGTASEATNSKAADRAGRRRAARANRRRQQETKIKQ